MTEANDGFKEKECAKHFPAITTPMLPEGTFKNKVAYITGGGTGLGKGMAHMLSKLGARVLIVSRKENVLEATAKEIQASTGNQVAYRAVDIRNANDVSASVDYCEKVFGALPDIIINNAAANFISPTERLSPNAVKTIIDIVLLGTFNVTLVIGKRLIAQKKGANFLSIVANYVCNGSGYVVPSACSKAGVVALTKSLAVEWAKYGLRFNAVAPGPIYTEGAFGRLMPNQESFSNEDATSSLPIGRFGRPEELANFISFIVSDYGNWLNGEMIVYDGGQLVNLSGAFNKLSDITNEQWDQVEKVIRATNQKSKL